jgi:hypothetical protein
MPNRFTERYAAIIMEAYRLVYEQNTCFTLKAFAAKTGYKDNRHTARALKQAVSEGRLVVYKTRFSDGRYRNVYYAPPWEGADKFDFYKRLVEQREALEQELYPKTYPPPPENQLTLEDAEAQSW